MDDVLKHLSGEVDAALNHAEKVGELLAPLAMEAPESKLKTFLDLELELSSLQVLLIDLRKGLENND